MRHAARVKAGPRPRGDVGGLRTRDAGEAAQARPEALPMGLGRDGSLGREPAPCRPGPWCPGHPQQGNLGGPTSAHGAELRPHTPSSRTRLIRETRARAVPGARHWVYAAGRDSKERACSGTAHGAAATAAARRCCFCGCRGPIVPSSLSLL